MVGRVVRNIWEILLVTEWVGNREWDHEESLDKVKSEPWDWVGWYCK